MKKTIIIALVSIVSGIIIALFGYFVFSVIQMQKAISYQGATLNEVVNFINKSIEAQKGSAVTK